MLLGPLSETISSVSWRDCALAGEKIAGAETMPATAAVDFRKSRRFMGSPLELEPTVFEGCFRKGHANSDKKIKP